jgi:hypothetical protein
MILVPCDATHEDVLEIIHAWIDLLAADDYETAFAHIGEWSLQGEWSPERLRAEIKAYRSPLYYSGVEEFTVTDWRTAQGGNSAPMQEVQWHEPSDPTELVGTASYDLPLNGKWSDLRANFILYKNITLEEDYVLGLEELYSWRKSQRDFEEWEQGETPEN